MSTEAYAQVRSRPAPRLVAAGVGYALVAGSFGSFSWQETVATFLPGVVACVVAARRFPMWLRAGAPAVGRHGLLWLIPLLPFSCFEIVNLALGSTPAHPTFSVLLAPALAWHPARMLAFFGWLALGRRLIRA